MRLREYVWLIASFGMLGVANAGPVIRTRTDLVHTLVDKMITKVAAKVPGFPSEASAGHPLVVFLTRGRVTIIGVEAKGDITDYAPKVIEALKILGPKLTSLDTNQDGSVGSMYGILVGDHPAWNRGTADLSIARFAASLRKAGFEPRIGLTRRTGSSVTDTAGQRLVTPLEITAKTTLHTEAVVTPAQAAAAVGYLGFPALIGVISCFAIFLGAKKGSKVADLRRRTILLAIAPVGVAFLLQMSLLFVVSRLSFASAFADVVAGCATVLGLGPIAFAAFLPTFLLSVSVGLIGSKAHGPTALDRAMTAYRENHPELKPKNSKYVAGIVGGMVLALLVLCATQVHEWTIGGVLTAGFGTTVASLVHVGTMWMLGQRFVLKGREESDLTLRVQRLSDLLGKKALSAGVAGSVASQVTVFAVRSSSGTLVSEEALRTLSRPGLDFLIASHLAEDPRSALFEMAAILASIFGGLALAFFLPVPLKPLFILPILLAIALVAYVRTTKGPIGKILADRKAITVTQNVEAAVEAILAEAKFVETTSGRGQVMRRIEALKKSAEAIGIDPTRATARIRQWEESSNAASTTESVRIGG